MGGIRISELSAAAAAAGGGGGSSALVVVKLADEGIVSDTVLSDDAELTLAVEAETTYVFQAFVHLNWTVTTPGAKLAITVPTNTTFRVHYHPQGSNTLADSEVLSASGVGSTAAIAGLTGTEGKNMFLVGSLVIGDTAGNVTIQWAQFTSNAATLTVKANSWIYLAAV